MKNQVLFSSKDKSKKLKCCLLRFLFGALWVKGRFLKFRRYHNFAIFFSKLSETTFYEEISKFR